MNKKNPFVLHTFFSEGSDSFKFLDNAENKNYHLEKKLFKKAIKLEYGSLYI